MDSQKTWQKMIELIKQRIDIGNYRTWFSQVDIKELNESTLILSVPSAFIQEQLRLRHLNLLSEVAKTATGKTLEIKFFIDPSKIFKKPTSTLQETEEDIFQIPQITQNPILNPKYTLENFVVGLTNNVAYAAAQAVVQNPGSSYNPLFFYGGTGVGKTHLMLGIGNTILTKNPKTKILYCSSEKFTNDYVEAIQTRRMGDMRNKYRSVDLLLVDDIQFFSGREQTQEEFFHTFNELTSKNSQIVLTSDRPPGEIAKLEDRLKSRFQGGLMVDIQMPDFDTRVAILKAKCQERGELLPEEGLNLIASSYETNTRELEGKLVQILQNLKAHNLQPTIENIQKFLDQRPSALKGKTYSQKEVLSTICGYFNIKLSELTGPKRNKELVLPRHIAMHILSEDLKLTVEHIGQILGGRDHTTVMHGRDKMKKLIQNDREVQRVFTEVKQQLQN